MTGVHDRVTRFSADLVEAATAEGARQSRSARQQLDHWVRVGRAVSSGTSAERTRVEQALAGDFALHDLTKQEAVVVHAEITAAIEERLGTTDFGEELAAEGITTVAIDDDGNLVEHSPDGSTSLLGPLLAG